MREQITNYLQQFNLDVRISHDARFVDQKCTPDIVYFIACCVINIETTQAEFTVKDIWKSQFFIENIRVMFNKPWANNKKAANEYNKVLSQPLKLLAYAHILSVNNEGKSLRFSIKNHDILEYISLNEFNAYNFLYCYFSKVISDSGLLIHFEEYRKNCVSDPKEAKERIYAQYQKFIRGNTPTRSRLDINRMFHKVFNIFAAEHELPGSSGKIMYKSDLLYNRINWRDVKSKFKTETREEAAARNIVERQEHQDACNRLRMNRAISLLRKIQLTSEVLDDLAKGDATQVHHIFPKSSYPLIAHYLENLILLTPTQHNTKAHPNNNTQLIDKGYQHTCLLAKSRTIEHSIDEIGERYYSKEAFLFVIEQGLNIKIDYNSSFPQIREAISGFYNAG